MSYLALYRKWRPAVFDDVKGQDAIVQTLKNQIISDRIGHAYLFCGTRGTGKTSVAKILARAVNCEHPVNGNPCNECASCRAILSGRSLNVVEIDAASNNGVDNIREIREQVQYPPTEGKYRVYIIDEVHMLSPGAFNALLKTLEEPPSYVIFILATTEVQKIPVTVLSRCQRYDFRRIPQDIILGRLKDITKAEGIDAEEKALSYIARSAGGAMRDAISLLEQCVAFHYGGKLTYDDALDVLGAVDLSVFSDLLKAVMEKQTLTCINILEEMVASGRELGQFVNDFIWYLRNLLILKSADDAENLIEMSDDAIAEAKVLASTIDMDTLMRFIRVFSELSDNLRYAAQKRVLIETALIKLTRPQMEQNLDSVLQRLNDLERQVSELSRERPPISEDISKRTPQSPETAVVSEAADGTKAAATVTLPKAQYDDLCRIRDDWTQILREMGSPIRAEFRDTELEPAGENCLCVVFQDASNYCLGSRPAVLGQFEDYVREHYQRDICFKARLRGPGEPSKTVYLCEGEAEKIIHTEIIIDDSDDEDL